VWLNASSERAAESDHSFTVSEFGTRECINTKS
jgi:hypothetical protein